MTDRLQLTVIGNPVPLERHRHGNGRTWLPARSKAYRELVQGEWLAAGRPSLGDQPFAASMRFIGARANADVSNLVKAIEDGLNGLAFTDDRQLVCIAGAHRLPVDTDGPRAEIEIWACPQ